MKSPSESPHLRQASHAALSKVAVLSESKATTGRSIGNPREIYRNFHGEMGKSMGKFLIGKLRKVEVAMQMAIIVVGYETNGISVDMSQDGTKNIT